MCLAAGWVISGLPGINRKQPKLKIRSDKIVKTHRITFRGEPAKPATKTVTRLILVPLKTQQTAPAARVQGLLRTVPQPFQLLTQGDPILEALILSRWQGFKLK